jgi:predicted acetyltransferase
MFALADSEACLKGEGIRAFYVVVKDKVAGFMVVKDEPDGSLDLPHYFILNGYRGLGLGKDAALMAFDLWPGRWRVAAPESSSQARAFWRRVIRSLTRKHYRVIHDRPSGLVFYEFTYPPLDEDAVPTEPLTQTAE